MRRQENAQQQIAETRVLLTCREMEDPVMEVIGGIATRLKVMEVMRVMPAYQIRLMMILLAWFDPHPERWCNLMHHVSRLWATFSSQLQ